MAAVMAPGDDPKPGSHPEDPPRSWYCVNDRHDECKGTFHRPEKAKAKCTCGCHEPMRSKRHDWLDDRWSDEIELERGVADAPPLAVARAAVLNGVATDIECAWFHVGKFAITDKRSATADSKWIVPCPRCPKSARHRVRTSLLNVGDGFYRAGRCSTCGAMAWLDLETKKPTAG